MNALVSQIYSHLETEGNDGVTIYFVDGSSESYTQFSDVISLNSNSYISLQDQSDGEINIISLSQIMRVILKKQG